MNTMKNKVQLLGHLGLTPEVRTLEKGMKVAKIRMATSDIYTNRKGERVSETVWHDIVAWGKIAEITEKLLQKGSEVMIDGRLVHREYTTNTGIKRYVTEIVASNLLILERKKTQS